MAMCWLNVRRLIGLLSAMVVVAASLASCTNGKRAEGSAAVSGGRAYDTSDIITLERTECFGACPVYTLTIHRDGYVRYVGISSVGVLGARTMHISADTVEALIREFLRINFFSMADEYVEDSGSTVFDAPSTITTLCLGGKTKRVRDYFGTPDGLIALERKIDRVTNSSQWVNRH
jgi:hypothetical protein